MVEYPRSAPRGVLHEDARGTRSPPSRTLSPESGRAEVSAGVRPSALDITPPSLSLQLSDTRAVGVMSRAEVAVLAST